MIRIAAASIREYAHRRGRRRAPKPAAMTAMHVSVMTVDIAGSSCIVDHPSPPIGAPISWSIEMPCHVSAATTTISRDVRLGRASS
jgi:hypothetical protein